MVWVLGVLLLLYVVYCLSFIAFQPYFIFRPEKLTEEYVFKTEVPYRELSLTSGDGANLHGLLLQPEATKGIVIYFHGNWHNLDNYLPFTKKFTDQGYSVLISDYRGYGKSTGHITKENFYADTEFWYSMALDYFPPEKIFIYGRSLGTAAATYLAAHHPSKYLILETPFSNMYDIARSYGMLFPDGNYLPFSLRTDLMIKNVAAPIMILHGTKDETVSIHSGKKLKRFLKPGDRFVEIKNGKHKNLDRFEDYHKAMDSLLNTGQN